MLSEVVKRVAGEMCEIRGYNVDKSDDVVWRDLVKKVAIDFFPIINGTKLNSKTLLERSATHTSHVTTRVVFVHSAGVTHAALAKINSDDSFAVECFQEIELSTNPLRSHLVPKHTLIRMKKGKADRLLPKIPSSDRIARFCGFPVGAIIRIQYTDYNGKVIKDEERIVIK